MARVFPGGVVVVAIAIGLAGFAECAERRDLPTKTAPPERVTYEGTTRAIFEDHCTGCHGGAAPAARYDLTTLEGIKGGGLDGIPNALAGDPQSLLVVKSRSGGSMSSYYSGPGEVALVERWVVEDSLARR